MICPPADAIQAFVQGQPSDEEARSLHEHIALCADCRSLVAHSAQSLFPSERKAVLPDGAAVAPAPPPGEAQPLAPGTVISRYVIEKRLGTGAAGAVYEAHDPQLARKIALKLLRPDYLAALAGSRSSGAKPEDWVLREAQAMARISHPNVVNVHDAGVCNGDVFIVMERVEGDTLANWLRTSARDWRDIVHALASAGRGLAAAHAAGLVHRDFKPENVLVGADGRVRVTDFGLARPAGVLVPRDDGAGGSTSANSTTTTMAGTPAYMAPEQWRGARSSAQTDQFSFCVVLFIALRGRHPFGDRGPDLLKLTRALASTGIEPAKGEEQAFFDRLDGILRRGLAVSPEDRYPSLDALVEALQEILDDSAPIRRSWRVRARGLAALSVPALAIAGLLGWVALRSPSDATDHRRLATAAAPLCGNGMPEPSEECDDGNRSDADGCLASCRWARCGDGKLRSGVEECDDGNVKSGDGCSSSCQVCRGGDASFTWDPTGHCYSRHDRAVPWHAAKDICATLSGNLVTLNASNESRSVDSALLEQGKRPSWIGILVEGTNALSWITGEPIGMPFWAKGEPKTGVGACVYQSPANELRPPDGVRARATWTMSACDDPRPFVCESAPWTLGADNHAYRLYQRPSAWPQARDACAAAGGHLVTIGSAEEQAFVATQSVLGFWIGATDASKEGTFTWITGEPFVFRGFAPAEPDGNGNHVVMGADEAWHDRQGPLLYPFMCEID